MLNLQEVIKKLKKHPSLTEISMETRINYQQIWRIKAGKDKNPTYKVLKALSDHLEMEAKNGKQ